MQIVIIILNVKFAKHGRSGKHASTAQEFFRAVRNLAFLILLNNQHCVPQSFLVDAHSISSGAFETQPFIGELICNSLTYASASPLFPGHNRATIIHSRPFDLLAAQELLFHIF